MNDNASPVKASHHVHPVVLMLGLWLLGLLVSLAVATWVEGNTTRLIDQQLTQRAQQLTEQLSRRMADYEKGVRGVRGAVLVGGMQHISDKTFNIYMASRDLDREFPGARGFGFIRRVPVADTQKFLDEIRLSIDPAFAIKQIAPHAGERYVIELIEPLQRNRAARGLDIASEPNRRTAALNAMHTGNATLTAPITVVQAADHPQRSFLMLLPVYQPGMRLESIAQREAATLGWTYATLIIDEVLEDFALNNADLIVQITDVTRPDAALPLFSMGNNSSSAPNSVWQNSFPIMGRQWQIKVQPSITLIAQMHLTTPKVAFALGAGISLLLSLLAAAATNSRRAKHALAAQRSFLASIVENSTDAIVIVQLDGRIISWNQQATHLFGYRDSEALGRLVTELVMPTDRYHEEMDMLTRCAQGIPVPPFDSIRKHRDGMLIDVAITAIPVTDGSGRTHAVAKVVRDIRLQKLAEQALKEANARLEHKADEDSGLLQSLQRDLRNIIDAVPSMIGYWDRNLINRFANRAYTQAFGIDYTTIPGMHIRMLLSEAEFQQDQPHIEAAFQGVPQSFERTRRKHDGTGTRQTMINYLPDIVDGEVLGFYALVTDISEITASRQQLSDLLRESEALMQTIHHHSLVSVADRHGIIIDANKAFCTLSGYSREELVGQDHRIVNSGMQSSQFWKSMWLTLRRGKPWKGEICNRAKDGSLYWVDSTIAPFHDEQGRVIKYISIRTDITANKHAQRRLAESEAFLERASQVSGMGSFRIDLRTGKVTWSKKAYEIHDVDEATPITQKLIDSMLTPEVRLQMHERMRIARETGKGLDVDVPLRTARGRNIWLHAVGEAELENGVPVAVIGAVRDITQQRTLEMALRASQGFLARVGAVAGVGGWEVDLTNDTVVWSPETHRLHEVAPGYVPTIATGLQFYTPESRPIIEQAVQNCIEHAQAFDLELEMISAKGRPFWAHATGTPEVADGKVVRLVGAFQDITERRKNEQQMSQLWSLLKSVLDSASEVSIIATDPDLVITVFNAGAERLLGYRSEEVISHMTPALFHDAEEMQARATELSTQLGRTITGAAVFTEPSTLRQPREWTYVSKDGSRVAVSLVVTPMHAQDGALIGYLGIAHDITHQRQFEASLRVAKDQAQNANLAKSEFLANMSHEIRTPLNAVIGLGYLLEQTSLNPDQQSMLSKIQFAGRALLGVINNVLDLSKIEAGEMTLEEVPCNLLELEQEIGDMLKQQAQKKGIELLVQPELNLPTRVQCDATRLRQMLINLLNNAIKFTETGHVALHTSLIEHKQDVVRMRFAVRDTGIGIAPEVIGTLFMPFAQADASTTRRFGGNGLGLSITRRLVELMGGDIGVNSVVGEGSEFWIELPLRVDGNATVGAATSLNILVAEASGHLPQGVSAMVRSLGWTPLCMKSGAELLQYLNSTSRDAWPDVLVIEASLLGTDQRPFITQLTGEFCGVRLPPRIAVLDQPVTQLASEGLGADVVITRPITGSTLFNAVNAVMASREKGLARMLMTAHIDDERAQWLPGVQVLVADDSEVNLEVARRILEMQGAIVTTCQDGAAAVAHLRANASRTDIVLMDIQMPVLDGNEAARCIRAELQLATLPIIALTAGALVSERQRSLECGMNDFLTKPFEPQALIRMVRRHVERVRGVALPMTLTDHSSRHSQTRSSMNSIDSDTVQRMFGDDHALFIKLLGRVLSDNAEFALPIAVEAGDQARQTLRSRMHKLRGSSGLIGAMTVHRLAGAAERSLEQNEPAEFVEVILAQLATALTTLREEAEPQLHAHPEPAAIQNDAAPLAAADLSELLNLLDGQNLAAMDHFETLSSSLRGMLDATRFSLLQQAVDQLDFQQAAALLRSADLQADTSRLRTLAQ